MARNNGWQEIRNFNCRGKIVETKFDFGTFLTGKKIETDNKIS